MSTVDQVKTNLLYYNYWTQVQVLKCEDDIDIVSGVPPEPVHPILSVPNENDSGEVLDQNDTKESNKCQRRDTVSQGTEFVYPININTKVTMERLSEIFQALEKNIKVRPKRIILGIIATDGTIVYYFIHDGIVKPKKN